MSCGSNCTSGYSCRFKTRCVCNLSIKNEPKIAISCFLALFGVCANKNLGRGIQTQVLPHEENWAVPLRHKAVGSCFLLVGTKNKATKIFM